MPLQHFDLRRRARSEKCGLPGGGGSHGSRRHNGMFYYAGLVFNRGLNPASAIIVSRLIDLNNKENADPNDILNGDSIQYIGTSILATGTSSQFLDKPTMAVDIPRFGATTCNLTVNQPGNGVVHKS